jgi:hypothetical protein
MINVGVWICLAPFGLILLLGLSLLSGRSNLQRELDELNRQLAVVKERQQVNERNIMLIAVLAFLAALPFLTLMELVMLGGR